MISGRKYCKIIKFTADMKDGAEITVSLKATKDVLKKVKEDISKKILEDRNSVFETLDSVSFTATLPKKMIWEMGSFPGINSKKADCVSNVTINSKMTVKMSHISDNKDADEKMWPTLTFKIRSVDMKFKKFFHERVGRYSYLIAEVTQTSIPGTDDDGKDAY